MNDSFSQRFIMTVFMGFAAACLLWFMRHVVEDAFDSTGAGWKKMFDKPKQSQKY